MLLAVCEDQSGFQIQERASLSWNLCNLPASICGHFTRLRRLKVQASGLMHHFGRNIVLCLCATSVQDQEVCHSKLHVLLDPDSRVGEPSAKALLLSHAYGGVASRQVFRIHRPTIDGAWSSVSPSKQHVDSPKLRWNLKRDP